MNELIGKMWDKYSLEYNEMNFEGFKQAIQTACKAQRNACIRRIRDEYLKNNHIDLISTVLTAEIERCDYD